MQVKALALLLVATPAFADGDASLRAASTASTPDDLNLRLTFSSFLYRQSGNDAAPLVDLGEPAQNASPVHRFFGDLRLELTDEGAAADVRVRQTTSERYQSGADGGGEYEIRTLSYRLGSPATHLVLGRQFIDAVGATKIDGASFTQKLGEPVAGTLFAGAYPVLGSRSVDTDYTHVRNFDGTEGALLVPLAAGAGITYTTQQIHGELGLAGVYVAQDIGAAPSDEKTRVFAASSGYWRPTSIVDVYHFALADVAGGNGANLTNGSVGVDARPVTNVQLSLAVNHVSTDLLAIAARNFLVDPDPTAIGVVQNNIALLRISQDMARGAASLALAQRRFELSLGAGVHRRPAVSVALADGSGSVAFPEARSADVTFGILDRRSIFGLRLALSATLVDPIGSTAPNWSRGTVVRAAASSLFAQERGQIEADVMGERFDDARAGMGCTTALDPFACYGTSTTTAAQTGALVSWRVGREWLLIADTHVGYQHVGSHYVTPMTPGDPTSPLVDMPVTWPRVISVTGFLRVQWRYR
jgi:hypothetical protein